MCMTLPVSNDETEILLVLLEPESEAMICLLEVS